MGGNGIENWEGPGSEKLRNQNYEQQGLEGAVLRNHTNMAVSASRADAHSHTLRKYTIQTAAAAVWSDAPHMWCHRPTHRAVFSGVAQQNGSRFEACYWRCENHPPRCCRGPALYYQWPQCVLTPLPETPA